MFNQAVICYTKAAADRASAAHNFFGHDFQTGTQNLFTADSRGAARRNADQNLLPLISTDTTDECGLTNSFAAWQEFDG